MTFRPVDCLHRIRIPSCERPRCVLEHKHENFTAAISGEGLRSLVEFALLPGWSPVCDGLYGAPHSTDGLR
jgi:hypothetical protein